MGKVRHSDGSAGDVDYGEVGHSYGRFRQPEPLIAAQILEALGDARSVLNVGAGAGGCRHCERRLCRRRRDAVSPARPRQGLLRRQGGRNIIEHQAIGTKLADCAIRLELARNLVWKAAWSLDHPDGAGGDGALPLHVMARVYTAEAAHEVTLLAAECFGAMGVMRDMPLQKHVHDAMVFLHSDDSDGAAKLAIAEAIAGYARPAANAA